MLTLWSVADVFLKVRVKRSVAPGVAWITAGLISTRAQSGGCWSTTGRSDVAHVAAVGREVVVVPAVAPVVGDVIGAEGAGEVDAGGSMVGATVVLGEDGEVVVAAVDSRRAVSLEPQAEKVTAAAMSSQEGVCLRIAVKILQSQQLVPSTGCQQAIRSWGR